MLALMDEAGLSAEDFGELMGVSGMTIRRWSKSRSGDLPKLYIPALQNACQNLLAQGLIAPASPIADVILKHSADEHLRVALANLGISDSCLKVDPHQPESFVDCLTEIGKNDGRRSQVESNSEKIFEFQKLGAEWKSRIHLLWQLAKSQKLTFADKAVAYGALFYLLTPIDFIPDHIPFFGLIDDFMILGAAAAFYARHFKDIMDELQDDVN